MLIPHTNPKILGQCLPAFDQIPDNTRLIWALGEIAKSEPVLIEFLEKCSRYPSRPANWWDSTFALWKLKQLPPVYFLIKTLSHKWSIKRALENLADKRAVVTILKAIREYSEEDELQDLADRLIKAFDKDNEQWRKEYNIAWLAGQLQIQELRDVLIDASKHRINPVRSCISEALGKLPKDPKILPILYDLLLDSYIRVRIHAIRSLERATEINDAMERLKWAIKKELEPRVRHEMDIAIRVLNARQSDHISEVLNDVFKVEIFDNLARSPAQIPSELDLLRIIELIMSNILCFYNSPYSRIAGYYSPGKLKEVISKSYLILIKRNDNIVACGMIYQSNECLTDLTWKIEALYVAPLEQGKGIGRWIVEELEKVAKIGNGETIQLEVIPNTPAEKFCYDCGYQVEKEVEHEFGGKTVLFRNMIKKILEQPTDLAISI